MSDELKEIREAIIVLAEILYDTIADYRLSDRQLLTELSERIQKANGATHE